MTTLEMQELFERGLGMFNVKAGKTEDVLYFLNEAQISFIDSNFNSIDKKQSFQYSQEDIDDLRILIKKDVSLQGGFNGNHYFYKLPEDYRHLLNDRSIVDGEHCANRLYRIEELYNILNHSFSKPKKKSYVSTLKGKDLLVYTNEDTIEGVVIDYLKNPKAITVDTSCELPEHTHRKIVRTAVSLFLEVNYPEKFNLNYNKNVMLNQEI